MSFGLNLDIQVTRSSDFTGCHLCVLATVCRLLALKCRLDLMADLKEKEEQMSVNRWGMFLCAIFSNRPNSLIRLVLVTIVGFMSGVSRSADIDAGFIRDNSIIAEVDPSLVRYDETRNRELYNRLLARLRNLPGIEEAAMAFRIPFEGFRQEYRRVQIPGMLSLPKDEHRDIPAVLARYNSVSDHYFKALGIDIVQGRDFTRAETESSGGLKVITDELLAFWPKKIPSTA
jgi:hypothetical protein